MNTQIQQSQMQTNVNQAPIPLMATVTSLVGLLSFALVLLFQ